MSEVVTYLYCVLRSTRAPGLRGIPGGLPRCSRPRLLELADRLWLVAADAPTQRYGRAALEQGHGDVDWVSRCAMAHEEVIEFFRLTPAVLPIKVFTLFPTDASAVASFRANRGKLSRLLGRLEGKREWTVRVTFDLVAPEAPEQGKRRADAVFARLGRWASARHRRTDNETEHGTDLLLDALFLIPMNQRAGFTAEARKAGNDLARGGLQLSLTGPWPPYHFAA